ncbi:MAG: hypothetical protein NTY50_03995 [Methylobacter sp.]|nr:hypothetical protein [Methylobacter sp.]
MEISEKDITKAVGAIVNYFRDKSTTENNPYILELYKANVKAQLTGISYLNIPDSVSRIIENKILIDELYESALNRIYEQKQTSDLGHSPVTSPVVLGQESTDFMQCH